MEREVTPQLPTSGQILGVLVRSLGISDPRLQSRTARRYFSGRLGNRVKESSRAEIIGAISDALANVGSSATPQSLRENSIDLPALAHMLDWHAVQWDQLRAFLRPRMARVQPHHLASVWRTYVRLVAIDLALRAAAQLHLTGASPTALDFLDWASVSRRSAFLNNRRREAGVSLLGFATSVGVNDNTVEAWMYHGARPSDENLSRIVEALVLEGQASERKQLARELRRLYWTSDIAGVLEEYIGTETLGEVLSRLRRYASLLYSIISEQTVAETHQADLADLTALGVNSALAEPLLTALVSRESDDEWRQDILAASNWIRRVLGVNLQVHRAEVDTLIQDTDGRVLKDWDVHNPRAYDHYQRSMELQAQGKINEALAEVAKAAELDPQDPANHYTLGSVKGGIGINSGDEALVNEGIEACWIAVTLDPSWVLPWTEIGWLLLRTGRAREAVEHLQGVRPECQPLDSHYYTALAEALRRMGELDKALVAFESAQDLNPHDPRIAAAVADTAFLTRDKGKSNRYARIARHQGISDEWNPLSELMKATRAESPPMGATEDRDRNIASLDAAIVRSPQDARLYLSRGWTHFVEGEDSRSIADLDAALHLNPLNADAYLLRGIAHSYLGRHDTATSDLSEAIRLNPDNAIAYYYRGLSHGEQDAFELAIPDLDEAIRLSPAHVDAYRARGDCHRYMEESDRAIADYEAALRLNPKDSLSYRGRGAAYRTKGELDRAITDYDTALQLNPKDSFAYRFRGDAYLAKNDYDRAVADFDVALEVNSADDVAYRGRGNAYLFSGKFDLALADFNAAVASNPASAVANYGRGVVREVMGDIEGADKDYRRARELGYDDSIDGAGP